MLVELDVAIMERHVSRIISTYFFHFVVGDQKFCSGLFGLRSLEDVK